MNDFILYFIISIFTFLLIYFLNKKSKKEVEVSKNEIINLRLNKFYLYFGYCSIALGLVSSILIFSNERNLILSIVFLLIFGGAGITLVYIYVNHRIIIYDTKIEVFNFLGKNKSINWSELKDVNFSLFKGVLVLMNKENEKLSIHQHIVGFKTIIQKIKTQSEVNIDHLKLPF
jgi:hypothetical protein